MKAKKPGEQLKGTLDLLLLAVLNDEGSLHGYAVITALAARSGGAFDLPEGTIYPALHRLERTGLIGSAWDSTSGRRRRMYSLTAHGRSELRVREQQWSAFAAGVGAVLRPAGALA